MNWDLDSSANRHGRRTETSGDTFFVINYTLIAALNLAQFTLTCYGRHKLDTDYNHGDYLYSNWDALKFCLAVACLTWVALAYGITRRFSGPEIFPWWASVKDWDQAIVQGVIWMLQLAAAANQTAFVNDYYHCVYDCGVLRAGSYRRNVAYAVLAWFLWVAWTPQFVWSCWTSRRPRG